MNHLKKTIAILLITSLAVLAGCSADEKTKDNNNNNNNNGADVSLEVDADENDDQDADENDDQDADENDDQDADENDDQDADENDDQDADDTPIEVDGTLALKDLTPEQVNEICAYRFDQFEPNYDPTTDAGKGNCFEAAFFDAYMESNPQKAAACQTSMDACTEQVYNRDDIQIDDCLKEDIRATCEITVDQYKACARDMAAASIANNTELAELTCDSLSTNNGNSAVEDILGAFEYPASCEIIDTNCDDIQNHQN